MKKTKHDIVEEERQRYTFLRDSGHLDYVHKSELCEKFFAGDQWSDEDIQKLRASRRPHLTINKILPTVAAILGEQIYQRMEVGFQPRNFAATPEIGDILTKVFMQISDNNELPWIRSEVFMDGIIGSRGFYDVRVDFSDSLKGEVKISLLNPRNVMIDPDADDYDPSTWSDVVTIKKLNLQQIEEIYGKQKADKIKETQFAQDPHVFDRMDLDIDRFGYAYGQRADTNGHPDPLVRTYPIIERQFKQLTTSDHFVDIERGDTRPVPDGWDENRINEFLAANPDVSVIKKKATRIRWRVHCEDLLLHDEWSPYDYFTVIPYFPYFRRGTTVGLVENLISTQEAYNKISSQELHVVNTSANSGWILKHGSLANMTVQELEQEGAKTGLVLELNSSGSIQDAIQKIQPNQIPQGLDRIAFKLSDSLKEISGVSDYMQGFAREDVAAKALKANQERGQANLAKVIDNLNRTDTYLARMILHCVQTYYTEPRILHITKDKLQRQYETVEVNAPTPEGKILNDLTLGEYRVIVTTQPERDTYEDSQFEQAIALRNEVGVQIPDETIIQASRLRDKANILQQLSEQKNSEASQKQAQLQQQAQEAEIAKTQAEAEAKKAEAAKKIAESRSAGVEGGGQDIELRKLEMEMALKEKELNAKLQFEREKHAQEMQLQREKMQAELKMKEEQSLIDMELKRQQTEADNQLKQQQLQRGNQNGQK